MGEVNELLNRLGELDEAPLIWVNKKVYDMAQEIERLKREKDIVIKLNHFVNNEIKRILEDDDLCHIEKLQEIAKVVGDDKE